MKPFPKGPIPPQREIEDHPPMDWPKGKRWPPENMSDYAAHPAPPPSTPSQMTPEELKARGLPPAGEENE